MWLWEPLIKGILRPATQRLNLWVLEAGVSLERLQNSLPSAGLSCGRAHESAPAIQSRQRTSSHPGVFAFPALSKFQSKLQNKRASQTSADAWVKPDETPLFLTSAAKKSLWDILCAEMFGEAHISLRNKDISLFWSLWKWSWLGLLKLLCLGWKASTRLSRTTAAQTHTALTSDERRVDETGILRCAT